MSEKERIARELDAAEEAYTVIGSTSPLRITTSVGSLQVELTEVNALACRFTDFRVQVESLGDADAGRLQQIADDLANRLSYLLEPVRPIEFDQESSAVQMRSLPPTTIDEATRFYELIVRPGEMSLCRYEKLTGQERRVIPADVTREVLARLVDDFTDAVG
jgi:hypothetical protein